MSFARERRGALWYNADGEQSGFTVMGGMFAAPLRSGAQQRASVTCDNENVDYTTPIPDYALYVMVYAESDLIVACEEVTSATVGMLVKAGMVTAYPLLLDTDTGDGLLHVQSPDPGTVVTVMFLGDV